MLHLSNLSFLVQLQSTDKVATAMMATPPGLGETFLPDHLAKSNNFFSLTGFCLQEGSDTQMHLLQQRACQSFSEGLDNVSKVTFTRRRRSPCQAQCPSQALHQVRIVGTLWALKGALPRLQVGDLIIVSNALPCKQVQSCSSMSVSQSW